MITGFNTDIKHEGVIYHVQTEDKGLETPLILSLIYNGGTILASKRSSYDDLLNGSLDENKLSERLKRQHNLMCAAVKAGRIEDLKRMTAKKRKSEKSTAKTEKKQVVKSPLALNTEIPKPAYSFEREISPIDSNQPEFSVDLHDVLLESPTDRRIPKPTEELIWEVPDSAIQDLIIEDVQIIEDEADASDGVIEILNADLAEETEIEDNPFVEAEAIEEKLTINLRKNENFTAGEQKDLEIFVNQGKNTKGLADAHILIKILGSAFRPIIFHGKTNEAGIAHIDLKLPSFKKGRAAILIKAMCCGEEVEIRRTISLT